MHLSWGAVATWAVLGGIGRHVAAISCGAQYLGLYAYNFDTYLDPSDLSYVELYAAVDQCNTYFAGDPETYGATVAYTSTGADGLPTLASQALYATLTDGENTMTTFTFQFNQVPFTALGNGNPATLAFGQTIDGQPAGLSITFTQTITPLTSLVDTTTTLSTTVSPTVTTQTAVVSATVTSTITATQTATSTVATAATTAPTPRTTITRTITPAPCIETKYTVTTTTVHPTCVSGHSPRQPRGMPRIAARLNGPQYEFPNSVDSTTTITTSTVVVFSTITADQTATTTVTSTATDDLTTTITTTDGVTATTTVTPAQTTIRTTTVEPRQTITSTRTVTITHSQCGRGLPPCTRARAPTAHPGNLWSPALKEHGRHGS